MITWGLFSGATAFVAGPTSFSSCAFSLASAEAGFFPASSCISPTGSRRGIAGGSSAVFMAAIPVSIFLGCPLSTALLVQIDGLLGLPGGAGCSSCEAVPAVILGFVTLFVLRNGPDDVTWLAPEQRAWLAARLQSERKVVRHVDQLSLWQVLFNKYVLAAALVYAGSSGASACLSIWQPQIIKSFGLTNMQTGLLNSIPFGLASIVMVLWGRQSDRTGERVWHTAVPLAITAASLASALLTNSLVPTILILCLAVTGTYAIKGPFWALSTEWLSASTAAAGIAQINAIGNLGGFVGTYFLGLIKDATGSYALGLLPLVALTAAGSVMVLILGRARPRTAVAQAAE